MKHIHSNHNQVKIENSDVVTIAPQADGSMLFLGLIFGFMIGKYFNYDKFKKDIKLIKK